MPDPQRVAIIGGGCSAMAAALALTHPKLDGRFVVTVYQQGWRLGGKGASGRGKHGRIEEHGLHVWMGFYENAFRMMREVYDELGRDPSQFAIASLDEAFRPAPSIGLADWTADSDWQTWSTTFPELPGEPGTLEFGAQPTPPTIAECIVRACEMASSLFRSAFSGESERQASWLPGELDVAALLQAARAALEGARGAAQIGVALVERQLGLWRALVDAAVGAGREQTQDWVGWRVVDLIDGYTRVLPKLVATMLGSRPDRDRAASRNALWALEIVLAAVNGVIRSGAYRHERGLDSLDDHDFAQWLAHHGASAEAVTSPFLRGLYSLMFAYRGGDYRQPSCAAGQCVRCFFRMFGSYRGSIFYKMQGGMGDVVFAPIYEVLRRRGVCFEFFHRLRNVGIDGWDQEPFVARLEFDRQAFVQGDGYAPLVDVRDQPCWPAEPLWDQLVDGERLNEEGRQFESHWDERAVERRTLCVNRDFEHVIVGVGLGAVPHVAAELVARDPRWRTMVERLETVATCALQLWMHPSLPELGWEGGSITMTSFTSPYDTWSDMTHLLSLEDFPAASCPGSLAYFCNVLPDHELAAWYDPALGEQVSGDRLAAAQSAAFVERDLRRLWPRVADDAGRFRTELLYAPDPAASPWEQQFIRCNVNPTDRYTLCLPGTTRYRISPLDPTYLNLTICGDWTDNGLNLGCVEGAVMSGLLAAHALAQWPALEDIVGYDHP